MKTTCIIVDDEPLARAALASLLSRFDNLEVVAECEDTFSALQALQNKKVDMMFLDIQMPEVSGLDFLRSLKHPPAVILTTAFREYALEGYELDVVDYLLKPVSFERLMKALDKYFHLYRRPVPAENLKDDPMEDFMTIRAERKNIRLPLNDILWVKSLKDYVEVFTVDNKYITQVPIGEMENSLPGDRFLRVHRSYLVNIAKVTAFTTMDVEIGDMEIPIGGSYRNDVTRTLNKQLNA
jgi:DNA-binding LytR/AlgR family response regulator